MMALWPHVFLGFSIALQGQYTIRWPVLSVSLQVDDDGGDMRAIREAIRTWNEVSCSKMVLDATETQSTALLLLEGESDARNQVQWLDAERWPLGDLVLGITTPLFDSQGRIVEADIALNGTATWSTNGAGGVDVESVVVHELGHLLGLQHVLGGEFQDDPPTMAPSVDPELRTRDLTADDGAGACFLYPKEPFACDDDADCPLVLTTTAAGQEFYEAQVTCSEGRCDEIEPLTLGSLTLGKECTSSVECAVPLFCQKLPPAGAFCSQRCVPDAESACPDTLADTLECLPYADESFGACLPEDAVAAATHHTAQTPGASPGSTGEGCPCDRTTRCDAPCVCDPECGCDCDATTACDDDCGCDPECSGSCQTAPDSGMWLVLVAIALGAWRRLT